MKNTKPLTFKTAKDMLQHIITGHDLYNTETKEYIFVYNDKNAIARYLLSKEQVIELSKECIPTNSYWSEHLSVGGSIYDAPENLRWCEDNYTSKYWVNTLDIIKEVSKWE